MKKVAIPTRGNVVDDHFGHCEAFTVFTFNNNGVLEHAEMMPSPPGCGCKSNVAAILQQKGVSVMLAGNMGDGALNVLNGYGIEVYRGCSGDVRQVAEAFVRGGIVDSGEGCRQHGHSGEGHVCDH